MTPESTTATARDPTPPPAAAPDTPSDLSERLLTRAKDVARSIGDRVRQLLSDDPGSALPLRVLVVDDHPDAADSLAAVLELLGCPVRVAYDGPSALAAAADFRPDVCLLDIMMPGMDGLELATHLRNRATARPLLLVATTALGSAEDRARTAITGFHFHLIKPVAAADLLGALNRFRDLIGRADAETPPPRRRATDQ